MWYVGCWFAGTDFFSVWKNPVGSKPKVLDSSYELDEIWWDVCSFVERVFDDLTLLLPEKLLNLQTLLVNSPEPHQREIYAVVNVM